MITYLDRASNLKSTITFHSRSQFLLPAKNRLFLQFIHNIKIILINFFRRVFSEYTEAVKKSLIPIDTNFPEICAFIIGFSFTVWTKMRLLMAI